MALLIALLDLLLIVLPFGVLFRFQVGNDIFFYPHDVFLGIIFLVLVRLFYKEKKAPQPKEIFYPLILFLAFCFFSLVLNMHFLKPIQFLAAFLYFVRIMIYSSLLFVFGKLPKNKLEDFFKKFIASGFVFIVFGIVQYLFYNDLGNLKSFFWDIHRDRLFGSVLDPNFAGAIIIIEVLLLLHLYLIKLKQKTKIVISIGLFVSLVALLLTYSRSTYIAFIAAIATFFILNKRFKFLFVIISFLFFAAAIIPKNFHIEGMDLFRTGSAVGRLTSFSSAVTVFSTSPIFGVGFNAYRYAQFRLGLLDAHWLETHAGAGVSDSYLFILATVGIVGFAFFIFFFYRTLKLLFKLREGKNTFAVCAIAAFVGILVHSFFDNTFFYPFVMLWLFMVVGIAVSKSKQHYGL